MHMDQGAPVFVHTFILLSAYLAKSLPAKVATSLG